MKLATRAAWQPRLICAHQGPKSLALRSLQMSSEVRVLLIVYNIARVSNEMVFLEAPGQVPPQVKGNGALALLRDSVVVLHDGLDGLCGFLQIVVGHLHAEQSTLCPSCLSSSGQVRCVGARPTRPQSERLAQYFRLYITKEKTTCVMNE